MSAFEGKNKLADKWEGGPYLVVRIPNPDVPVYEVKKETGKGPTRTLHRNLLLAFTSLPAGTPSDAAHETSEDMR